MFNSGLKNSFIGYAYEDDFIHVYIAILSLCVDPPLLPAAVFQKLQNPTSLNAVIENAREWSTSEERFVHPYQFELEHFEPNEEQMQLKEPQVNYHNIFIIGARMVSRVPVNLPSFSLYPGSVSPLKLTYS